MKMRPFKTLISAGKALEIMLGTARPVKRVEEVELKEAHGRVLASDVISGIDVPPFDRAAMDGYAVMAHDIFKASAYDPVVLNCIDRIYAGDAPRGKVESGQCIQIATGAPMPEGADAVVMVEQTSVDEKDEHINIFKPQYPGGDVSRRGSDIARDGIVLPAGVVLQPATIGSLAAVGVPVVPVLERPKIMVVPTGDEVIDPGASPEPGKIFDINTYSMGALVRMNGCEAIQGGITPDSEEELENVIRDALKANVDMLIFTGGSSVGERDVLVNVLGRMGKVLFHGAQIKPGKPTLFGSVKGLMVVGLPGYPTSCLTNGYHLIAPVLRKMASLPANERTVKATMAARVVSTLGRMQIFTVGLKDDVAIPVFRESGAITSLARAVGYILIPDNTDIVEKGEEVTVHLL